MHQTSPHKQLVYRLVLISSDSCCVLVPDNGTEIRLPRVSIPIWTRTAAEIQKAIRNNLGASNIVLDFLKCSEDLDPCVVARSVSSLPPNGLVPANLDQLPVSDHSGRVW
jgi:hypothetical protein